VKSSEKQQVDTVENNELAFASVGYHKEYPKKSMQQMAIL